MVQLTWNTLTPDHVQDLESHPQTPLAVAVAAVLEVAALEAVVKADFQNRKTF